ncbi:hypothetical protein [uncultured Tyzzerella sp.]|uniref:hypothetical protein n=1 Tax=uncultured Tyzzerella sp. TaxID=2321398 RepID=UPI0029432F2C|nr:hypothetical protein [uncultured Tyzzerella sp.]
MNNIIYQISDRLNCLNLSIKDTYLSEKIILMAINSVKNFIQCEINPFIDFSIIEDIFINIVIGEYLMLVKSSNLESDISLDSAIKSIKEGDTSVTYFENKNMNFQDIINYFLYKKRLLYRYKQIVW